MFVVTFNYLNIETYLVWNALSIVLIFGFMFFSPLEQLIVSIVPKEKRT